MFSEWSSERARMINIRRASPTDCESIARVHAAAVKSVGAEFYTPEEIQAWSMPKPPESYETAIRDKEFFAVENNDVVVGFGVLDQRQALIEAVYVDPEAGGRGIGLQIMRKLEERARALGLTSLSLNASLNAVSFYERAGYVPLEKSRYRLSTGVVIDCVPMVKAMNTEAD